MDIDFRKNANVLTAIHSFAKEKQRTPTDPYVVESYELHARPDLVERLKQLMAYTPEASLKFAYGIPVLCAPNGRVFATAGGSRYLCLYLPTAEEWGRPYEEYGSPWREGSAWIVGRKASQEDEDRFATLLRLAYASVVSED